MHPDLPTGWEYEVFQGNQLLGYSDIASVDPVAVGRGGFMAGRGARLPPAGWLGPWRSETPHTLDLLTAAGYRYTMDWPMDDQPVWMKTRKGRILSVPYPHEVNDIPMIALHHGSADKFAEVILDNLEEMLEQSKAQPLVFGVSIHAFLVGQPFRLKHFRKAMEGVRAASDRIWFATTGQIAEHYAKAVPA